MKKLVPILLIIMFFMACSGEKSNNSNSDDNTQEVNKNFTFKFISAEFIPCTKDRGYYHPVSFKTELEIKNNTLYKFTSFYVDPEIVVEFDDGSIMKKKQCGELYFKYLKLINSQNPLLPEMTLKYIFIIPQDGGCENEWCCPFDDKNFERTPSSIVINFNIRAISVDREYKEIATYTILDQWKTYQEGLGLR